ncbi:GDSL-type esterase/lipase family protein [Massilia sp. TS11]|uniref:GDSL-type esterase/lipase family protein n=1 Tax=Massilia sp. TS11 TaxID=2908003 RepID=UPI001EDA70FF|nr:GDSL-type esterase/lipase family protein [Massilia sp. TS11]MCG2583947.1 GDSL-type esterase/lipase family protein [Massilia sp. TS11]
MKALPLLLALLGGPALAAGPLQFDFSAGPQPVYSAARGYGSEPQQPQAFSVDVPEGNYRVTVTLGGKDAGDTTIKAELRRLMLEAVATAPGQRLTRRFIVNVRTPKIPALAGIAAGEVRLKTPREAIDEAWAWDGRLTLSFEGKHPQVQAVRIEPVSVPTVFLLGDSTVADQSGEPYASWGQMLPRFVTGEVAVANHAESGETYRDSIGRRRLDKVVASLRPGDTVLLQFGHNDQKQLASGKGSLASYQAELTQHIDAIRARGGVAVVLSPMERRGFNAQGEVLPSLIDYANAARSAAAAAGAPFIDLNALSKPLYQRFGVEGSKQLFAQPAPDRIDNTHHSNRGAWELARLVASQLKQVQPALAPFIAPDLEQASFAVPPSPGKQAARPLGDEAVAYVFAYFIENGKDGLHLAASTDGYHWEKLGGGAAFLRSDLGAGLMRDPCLLRGPDGLFHLVWTTGWNDRIIGYAASADLKTWTTPRALPVMESEPTARNAWAPEITWDAAKGEYLLMWASTVPGRFAASDGQSENGYNHRIYTSSTRDLYMLTPPKVMFDPGFSSIDATFVQKDGQTYLLYKDETRYPPRKHLLLAPVSGGLQGQVGAPSAPISPAGEWAEGPTALQVGRDVIVYYDAYQAKHYRALRSRDLIHWENVSDKMHFPDEGTPQRMRHGTAIAVPASLLPALR